MSPSTKPSKASRGGTTRSNGSSQMVALSLSEVYQLLEPGPVVLLTTSQSGRSNVMTMSWHMMVEFVPPLVACVVSSEDYSFAALTAEHECVIAIPSVELAPVVVKVGNSSGRTVEKFKKFGLTPRELEIVSAVVAGYANREIAEYFKISEDTVKHHLSNIFDKLGVSTRLELALFAVNQGLPLKTIV